MARRKTIQEIRLDNFGAITGLVFESGGAAEMLMTALEVSRLVGAWLKYESAKTRPDERTVSALKVLSAKAHRFDARLLAEVPIAQRRAKIIPVVPR